MRPIHFLFVTRALPMLAAVAVFNGCATPATHESDRKAASSAPMVGQDRREIVKRLAKGMTEKQVRALLGEPERRIPQQTALGAVEAWIYRSTHTTGTRHLQTGSEKYSRPNPITNVIETIEEPIYGVESVFVTEDHVLVFRHGVLLEWKTVASESKNVS